MVDGEGFGAHDGLMRRVVLLGVALGLALVLAACQPGPGSCRHTGTDCTYEVGNDCTPNLGVGCGPDGTYSETVGGLPVR